PAVLFDHRQQAGLVLQQVDLVQQQEGRLFGLFNQVEREAVAGAEAGRGVAHQEDDGDLLERVGDQPRPPAIERVARFVDAGRVVEDDLAFGARDYVTDAGPRGLWL